MLTEVIMFGNIMLFVSAKTKHSNSFFIDFLTILSVSFTLAVFVIALFMEYESLSIIESFIFLMLAWLHEWLWIRH